MWKCDFGGCTAGWRRPELQIPPTNPCSDMLRAAGVQRQHSDMFNYKSSLLLFVLTKRHLDEVNVSSTFPPTWWFSEAGIISTISRLLCKWRNKLTFLLPELIDAAELLSLATTLPTMQRDQHQRLASRACVLQDQLTSLHTDTFVSVSNLLTQMTSLEDIYQTSQTLTGVVQFNKV